MNAFSPRSPLVMSHHLRCSPHLLLPHRILVGVFLRREIPSMILMTWPSSSLLKTEMSFLVLQPGRSIRFHVVVDGFAVAQLPSLNAPFSLPSAVPPVYHVRCGSGTQEGAPSSAR